MLILIKNKVLWTRLAHWLEGPIWQGDTKVEALAVLAVGNQVLVVAAFRIIAGRVSPVGEVEKGLRRN